MRIGIITDTNDLAHLLQNATVEDFGEFTRIAQSMDVDLSSFYYILYTYNNEIGLLRALLYTAVGWWFWELLTTLKIEKDIIQGKMSLPSRIPVVSVLIMRFSTTMLLIFSMFLQESTLHDCNLNARLCVFFQGLTKTSSTALFIHMASVLWKENFWISKVLLPFLVLLNFSTSLYKVSGTRGLRLENLPLIGDVNGCVTPRFVIAPNAVDSATMIAVAMITILLLNVRLAATSSRTILGKDLIYRVYAFALLNLALPMTLLVVLYCDLTSGLQSVIQIVTVAAISIASSRAYSYLNKVATKYKRAMNFGRTTGVGFDGDRKRFFGNAANLFVNTQRDDGLGEGETDRGWEGGEVLEEDEVGEKSVEVVEEIKDDPSNIDLEKAMSISRNQSAQSRKSDDFDEVDDAAQHFKETSGSSSQTEVSAPRSRKVEDDQRAWNQEESEGVEETSNSSLGSGKDRKISRKMVPRLDAESESMSPPKSPSDCSSTFSSSSSSSTDPGSDSRHARQGSGSEGIAHSSKLGSERSFGRPSCPSENGSDKVELDFEVEEEEEEEEEEVKDNGSEYPSREARRRAASYSKNKVPPTDSPVVMGGRIYDLERTAQDPPPPPPRRRRRPTPPSLGEKEEFKDREDQRSSPVKHGGGVVGSLDNDLVRQQTDVGSMEKSSEEESYDREDQRSSPEVKHGGGGSRENDFVRLQPASRRHVRLDSFGTGMVEEEEEEEEVKDPLEERYHTSDRTSSSIEGKEEDRDSHLSLDLLEQGEEIPPPISLPPRIRPKSWWL